jgi:excisionase family DNA binding protein
MTEIDAAALAEQIAGHLAAPAPPLLNAEEAGRLLNVPASWVRGEARAGRIPAVRLGKYTRFDPDELTAWRRARSVGPRPNGKPMKGAK